MSTEVTNTLVCECEVCCGLCAYPIINKRGTTLYEIECPECFGVGAADPVEERAGRLALEQEERT